MKEPGFEFNIKEEGLVSFIPFASNRIVIIGTAERGTVAISNGNPQITPNDVIPYSNYSSIEEVYGKYDEFTGQAELRLMRGVDLLTNAGANYIYPIRICDGSESGGTLRLRKNENVINAWAAEIGSADTGSYSKDIQIRIRDNDSSPIQIEEIIYPDGTATGFTLRYYPTTGSVSRIVPGGSSSLLTGSNWTTVEVANLVDPLDGETLVEEGGTPDWDNATSYTVHYGNVWDSGATYGWGHLVHPYMAPSYKTGSAYECIIYCDTGSPIGNNFFFPTDATQESIDEAACKKGKAIRVRYFYDTKDLEVKWNDKTEIFQNLNSVNNWIKTIESGSSLIKMYSDTGTDSTIVLQDSGTSTMPLNMDWTNLGEGNDGRNVSLSDYRAAFDLIAETNWDFIVLPGVIDRSIHNMVKSKLNTDELNNFEQKAVFGHDTGESFGEIIGRVSETRDKRIRWVSFGEGGIKHTNRYTNKVETGSASYGACIIAANASKRSVSTDAISYDLDGCEGIFGEWTKAQREMLLDYGIMSVRKDGGGYRVNRDISSSTNSVWIKNTTVQIVDYARRGTRQVLQDFKGKKNISRIRKMMESKADDFLQSMVDDEHLIGYNPTKVEATRAQQISGITKVTTNIKPVYHIEYIKTDMSLE